MMWCLTEDHELGPASINVDCFWHGSDEQNLFILLALLRHDRRTPAYAWDYDTMNQRAKSVVSKLPEAQLESFVVKFEPRLASLIRDVRGELRRMLPSANELVYDNYNFFVIGYSPTEKPSDTILSIAADANAVRIAFPYVGARLSDPDGILEGEGKSNRSLRIESAAQVKDPKVVSLIQAASGMVKQKLPASGRGKLVIRSVSQKQRPRRKA
jgi:hypothetical protein